MSRTENIKVGVRFRPFNRRELSQPEHKQNYLEITENSVCVLEGTENTFTFDHVFSPVFSPVYSSNSSSLDEEEPHSNSQEKIYTTMVQEAIHDVCQGYNACVFTYGNTSSGKSYTMFGHESGKYELRGIIPRVCHDIFNIINNDENTIESRIKCSFLEIYQERIRDLLVPKKKNREADNSSLKIRQSTKRGIYVQGLLEKFVYSDDDILKIISDGSEQRVVASTSLNSVSSRSHSVLTIFITQVLSDGSEVESRINLIDLAGSENVGKSEVQGVNLAEAKLINKSLSTLGNVINALTEKNREHVPFRDSKLTYLIQDSLGGNSKTIVICTASPSILSKTETISTLKFAKRIKEVRNIPKINKNESIPNLLRTIEEMGKKYNELLGKYNDTQNIIKSIQDNDPYDEKSNNEIILLQSRNDIYENRIEILEKQLEKEKEISFSLEDVLDKQKDLSLRIYRKYAREKSISHKLETELNSYRHIFQSIKEAKPEIIPMILERTSIPVNYGSIGGMGSVGSTDSINEDDILI